MARNNSVSCMLSRLAAFTRSFTMAAPPVRRNTEVNSVPPTTISRIMEVTTTVFNVAAPNRFHVKSR